MSNFDGTNAIELLHFLKDVRITFNSQHLTEGVAIRVLAHFLERDAERLHTSYSMRGIRASQLHDDLSWPGFINQFIKRYLTDEVLGVAHDAVVSAQQKPHETEKEFADRLESNAFKCTAVFTEQALAHYFVRGLAPATRAAVAETVQRLPAIQKTDLSIIRRIATAEGNTFRARRWLPLPDPKPAARGGRTSRSNATSSHASAIHVNEEDWEADPVLVMRGWEAMGGRLATPASTETTGSFATAFTHTPVGMGGPDNRIAELDISRQAGGSVSPCVPTLTEEAARQAAKFASADGSAYVCCLCRTHGHAMYACLYLAPEQWTFTAYRNYQYQLQTSPGMRNLLQQSVAGDRGPRSGHANRPGGRVRFAPRGGGYRREQRDFRQADTRYPRQDGKGERGRPRLPPGVQNAIMYLQDWAGDPHTLPLQEGEREPTLSAPQILQRPNVEDQGREVPEYFADTTAPEWVGPAATRTEVRSRASY